MRVLTALKWFACSWQAFQSFFGKLGYEAVAILFLHLHFSHGPLLRGLWLLVGVPKSHLNFFPMGLGFPRVQKISSLGFPGIFSNGKILCKTTKIWYFGKDYGKKGSTNEFVTFQKWYSKVLFSLAKIRFWNPNHLAWVLAIIIPYCFTI